MNELLWIKEARAKIGTYEIIGKRHNPIILAMWETAFKAKNKQNWILDDETPWCGGFVAYCMAKANLAKHIPNQFPRARAWEDAGTKLNKPAYGCIVVFSRKGGGHVGFLVGKDRYGNLMILGGNQSNAVNIKPFAINRVTAYRWCGTQPLPAPHRYNLPLLSSNGRVSKNEA